MHYIIYREEAEEIITKGFLSLWSYLHLHLDPDGDPYLLPSDVSPPLYVWQRGS